MATRKTQGVYPHGEKYDENTKYVAIYYYTKADGSPYLMVKRTENKHFPQFHYVSKLHNNASDENNWKYGAPKGPKIPFNLPAISEAPDDSTLDINEGEKDALTLIDLSLLATTCASSFNGWSDEVTQPLLRFSKIRIHKDNDETGEEFVRKVVASFKNCGYEGEIEIINYADMHPTADPSDWIGDTHLATSEKLAELRKAFLEYCDAHSSKWVAPILEEIVIETGYFGQCIDKIEYALTKTFGKSHNIMVRGGSLVQPIWEKKTTKFDGDIYVTTLKELKSSQLSDILTKRICTFKKWKTVGKDMKLVPISPPIDHIVGLLERGYWDLPYVSGVVQCPTMRPNGTILWQQGYDYETQLYLGYNGYFKLRPISDICTKEHAMKALKRLKELLKEFKFVNQLDMTVALSGIISAVVRGAFPVCPLHLVVAHTMSNGKSFLVDLFAVIATGKKCPVTAYVDKTGDQSENEKRLGALILSGQTMFSLDNLTQNLQGSFLCQITERPYVSIRVLGESRMVECEFGGTIYATGNNIGPVGDMVRRTLVTRLDSKSENPEALHYDNDPIKMVLADRGGYVSDVLTIVKAFLQSGETVDCHPVASYGEWSKFVREPLLWLGECDVWDSTDEAKKNDTSKTFARQFIDFWSKGKDGIYPGIDYSVKAIIKSVNPKENDKVALRDSDEDTLFDLLVEECGDRQHLAIDSKRFAGMLRRLRGQMIDGYRIMVASEDAHHGHKWILERY